MTLWHKFPRVATWITISTRHGNLGFHPFSFTVRDKGKIRSKSGKKNNYTINSNLLSAINTIDTAGNKDASCQP